MLDLIAANPVIASIVALVGLGLAFGALLGFASEKLKVEGSPIVDQINDLLPQTQCGQCGYPGCKPYAEAISEGEAINRCPPGGETTIQALATLLDVEPQPLDAEEKVPQVAYVREDECIGCTKCIQACPVDAILGAAKQMHTIIASECTGCDLCVEPCPVDCIEMRPIATTLQTWKWENPAPVPATLQRDNIIATDGIATDGSASQSSDQEDAA